MGELLNAASFGIYLQRKPSEATLRMAKIMGCRWVPRSGEHQSPIPLEGE